jgi:hypothetical protein
MPDHLHFLSTCQFVIVVCKNSLLLIKRPKIPPAVSPRACDIGGVLSSGKWYHIPISEINVPLAISNSLGKICEANPSIFILDIGKQLDKQEIRRQEVMYELYVTEKDYIRDLKLIINLFKGKMIERHVIPEKHLLILFANVENLLPIHEEFYKNLKASRLEGLFRGMGYFFSDMV